MARRTLEAVYALSALQEGMLFHSLYEPESGVYVEQVHGELVGDLDVAALRASWQGAVDRYPVLRTAFVWKRQRTPRQVVEPPGVGLAFTYLDWSAAPAAEREALWAACLRDDRGQGFDLARAPLMRVTLIRLDAERHRLLWTSHHILLDGWSLPLLLAEVLSGYAAALVGRQPEWPARRPYADYIAWLQAQDLAAAETFWRRELRGVTPSRLGVERDGTASPSTLVTPVPPPPHREQQLGLDRAATAALEAAARGARLTLNSLAQGAWALLLSRYGGGEDVVFGATLSGRGIELPGIQEMLGLFISTLPVRVAAPPSAAVAGWLRDLQARQLALQPYEWSPLPRVQAWSEVPRGQALFDTILVFENYPLAGTDQGDLRLENVVFHEASNYPLALAVIPGERLSLRADHAPERFDATAMSRLLGHYQQLLVGLGEALAAGGERQLADLPLLTPAERHQVAVEWARRQRGPQSSIPPLAPITESLAHRAALDPDAVAVEAAGERLTFGALDRQANRLASRLRALGAPGAPGVGRETVVGLAIDRTVQLFVGLFGIWKAGGAFLPLDPTLPAERLAYLLADSGARAVVSRQGIDLALPAGTPRLDIDGNDGHDQNAESGQDDAPLPVPSLRDLAYVIYTSGSTGRPKGVMVEHGSLAALLATMQAEIDWRPGDRMPCLAPFSFDIFLFETCGPLLAGATVALVGLTPALDFAGLLAQLDTATHLHAVPALMRQIVDWAGAHPTARRPRALFVGGDAVPVELLRDMRAVFPEAETWALYGPTEGTILATSDRVPRLVERSRLGRPLPGVEVELRDAAGAPVPIGVSGEIVLGGTGVARGYLGREELTGERFPSVGGQRWYRTGDLARWLPDGNLEFIGRADDQLKVRGFRIEPGEIEASLLALTGINAAAVVAAQAERTGERRLIAHLVTRPGAALDVAALRGALRLRLPEYMLPTSFVLHAALPLTPNGKVDRQALALAGGTSAPPAPDGGTGEAVAAPRNATERTLAAVWAAVLGREGAAAPGIHDDFFALGGDSILSIQIVARAAQAGLRITPRQIFELPTIAGLAGVAVPSGATGELAGPRAEQGEVCGPLPPTPVQRQLLAAELVDPHHFNQALLLRPRRPLAPAVVNGAWAALLGHHDALRLRLRHGAAGRQLWNAGSEGITPLHRLDLSRLPPAAARQQLASAAAAVQGSLDLAAGPLARAVWLDLGGAGGEARLLLVVHHLAIDGVSWRVLAEDLETLCGQGMRGEPPRLPPKTTSFRQWAVELGRLAATVPADPEASWWLQAATAPATRLAVDHPAADNLVAGERTVSCTFDAAETAALLRDLPAVYRARIDEALLAVLALTLAGEGGAWRVEVEGHGREEIVPGADLSRTVGWFTSQYPVRLEVPALDPGAGSGLGGLLLAIKDQLRAVPGHGIGYGLLRWLREDGEEGVGARLRRLPAPAVSFNYLGQIDRGLAGEDAWFSLAEEPSGPARSPRQRRAQVLAIGAQVAGGRLQVDWDYAAEQCERAGIERLAAAFSAHLRRLAGHCRAAAARGETHLSVSDVPLAGSASPDGEALRQLLAGAADAVDAYPLSPLQEGLYFHSLYAPASGAYVEQLACTFDGALSAATLTAAWRRMVESHAVLRTSFHGEPLERPLQLVHAHGEVVLERRDWRALPPLEQEERLTELARAERERGFDLGRQPLMRWVWIAVGEARHVLLWSHHHLLLDGWSYSALVAELLDCCAALLAGREPRLPARRPYRDYIAWLLQRGVTDEAAYWQRDLAGYSPPAPFFSGRAAAGAEDVRAFHAELGATETAALLALARNQRLTANTIVQAAWGIALARLAAQDDMVFGAVTAGRPPELPGVEAMIGLFLNTIPVRLNAAGALPVLPWLHQLQAAQIERRLHEHSPLAQIQQWSGGAPGAALFDCLYVFENYPLTRAVEEAGEAVRVTDLRFWSGGTGYALAASAFPGERLRLRLDCAPRRCEPVTAARLLGHFLHLVVALATPPASLESPAALTDSAAWHLADLSSLGPAERQQLTVEWQGAAYGTVPVPTGDGIQELIEAWAARQPDAVAVTFQDQQLSYGELDRRANRLAHHLRARGAGPEIVVALCLERSLELVLAILAVWKAGAAYLPMDPGYPDAYLSGLWRSSGAALLLTDAARHARLGAAPAQEVLLHAACGEATAISRQPATRPAPGAVADNLAYVLYTSGSTGVPKGVLVPHRGLFAFVAGQREHLGQEPGAHVLQHASASFDMSVGDVLQALCQGGTLCLGSREQLLPGEPLLRLLLERGITVAHLVPSALAALPRRALPALALLAVGGEALAGPLAARWAGGHRLLNLYGPTEATIYSVFAELAAADLGGEAAEMPIGRPIGASTVHLLDADLHPRPAGASGEIHLGGVGVARGYLGRPDLTAERFLPDPFAASPGARLYRTGDVGRWRPDGRLDFIGRNDQQVKIRGFRIELGEIEAALQAHPAVRQAAVVLQRDSAVGPRLAAFAVLELTPAAVGTVDLPGAVDAAALRAWLAGRLPAPRVPATIAILDALPIMANGKLDRRSLAATAAAAAADAAGAGNADERAPDGAGMAAARTPTEVLLAGLWAEALGRRRVGIDDDFFVLGGHSLIATRLVSRIRGVFGVELPHAELFARPTVAGLAAVLDTLRRRGDGLNAADGSAGATPSAMLPVNRDGELLLSFAQERLWFLDQLAAGGALHKVAAAVRASGRLRPAVLAASLSEIVRRHEVLRTTFHATPEHPVQVVGAPLPVPLPVVDLRRLPGATRAAEAMRQEAAERARPFDLATGPLLRCALLRLADEEHVVLWTLHHIVTDGWSTRLVLHEMATLYAALSAGRPSPLPELPLQYADFAAWQRHWLRGEALERQLAYWRRQLAGLGDEMELAADRPRVVPASLRRVTAEARLAPALAEELGALARRQAATPFMVLLAAFQALLGRYTGAEDVAVGTPVANRNRAESEALIGFFVNTLVLRGDLAGDPGFGALLARLRTVCLDAYAHQDVPFEKVIQDLAPRRRLGFSPLFQVMFTFDSAPPPAALALGDLELTALPREMPAAEFDLVFTAVDDGDGIALFLRHGPELFDGPRMQRLLGHLAALLAGAAANPRQRLADLPLLGAAERQQLLVEWALGTDGGAATFPVDLCFHDILSRQAARRPDGAAVSFGDATLSFGELERRSDALAARLRGLGAAPGVRLGVCLERSLELVIAIVAALKAGAAYVPLDPDYPAERLAFLAEDADLLVTLTRRRWAALLPSGRRALVLDGGGPLPGVGDALAPAPAPARGAAAPASPAYVIYTSGTTGAPKGAVISHAALVNYAHALRAAVGAAERPLRVSLNARVAFDASLKQLSYLLWGHCLVVLDDAVRLDPAAMVAMARRAQLDVLDCAPSQLKQLLRAGLTGAGGPATVLVGGEAIDAATWDEMRRTPEVQFFNHYGPTECTVNTTICRVAGDRPRLGWPIANVCVHLLDRHGSVVPGGVPGEACIGDAGVGMGYLGRPALTAERFVPDPFAAAPGWRLYRSGDLLRRLPAGDLEFLGRIDRQIKVRGFRIEPAEIEAALARHPAVAAAAVTDAIPAGAAAQSGDAEAQRILVAFWVGDDRGITPTALRAFLRASLPEPQVPSAFLRLAALPLTPNGKIDRRALQARAEELLTAHRDGEDAERVEGAVGDAGPGVARQAESGGGRGARTPTEELVGAIWAQQLGREAVGVDEDFFALGGHSLLATRVIARLRDAFGVELPLRWLFEAPTVEVFSRLVEASLRDGSGMASPPAITRAPRQRPLPLSFAQLRLWILDRFDPGLPVYNMASPVRLTGRLDTAALARGLAEVVRRHEILHTHFVEWEGEPAQLAQLPLGAEPAGVSLPCVDLRHLPSRAREAEVTRRATAEAWRGFDLRRGPLLRATLLALGGDAAGTPEHALLLTMHHIAADAGSTDILVRELLALYQAFGAGLASPLAELPVQYADYAVWQRRWLSDEVLAGLLAYWRQRLAAPPVLDLATDRPRAAVQSFRAARVPLHLAPPLARRLRALAQQRGATLFMLFVAAFQALLHRHTGQRDIVVGSPISNRDRLETEGLIGFFVNMLALRIRLTPEDSFAALLDRGRETALGAYTHRDLPFERLVDEVAPQRDLGRNALFQATVQVLPARPDPSRSDLAVSPIARRDELAPFDLGLLAVDGGEAIEGSLQYNPDLLDPATARRMVAHLTNLLAAVATNADSELAALPMLAAAESHQLLSEWNDTRAAARDGEPLAHQRVARQASADPHRLAIDDNGRPWTRGDLAARAALLASRLRRLGVGPEVRVALCVERSAELVAAMLGVLAAGGAYVPIDPGYPAERQAFLLADSGATVVLTRAALAPDLPAFSGRVLLLDAAVEEPVPGGPVRADEPAAANLAYVVYTSGSTGRPKGVAIAHANLAHLVDWYGNACGLGEADRVSLLAAPAFDAFGLELWAALAAGASVHLAADEVRASPPLLAAWLRRERITVCHLPVASAESLLDEPAAARLDDLSCLQTGGDQLRRRPGAALPFPLFNNYGPTEITVIAVRGRVAPRTEGPAVPPPIGRPVANATARVLDGALRPVAVGVTGELCIGGAGVGRGYLGQPGLTAERFVPDPHGDAGSRLYRTGDLARLLADGRLEFLGRRDQQVKVRGFRVELGGIEAVLAAHPAVAAAAVAAWPDGIGGRRLVAWVVPRGDAPADLRPYLRARLAEFEVPAVVVLLAALPLTAHGKVDHGALPEPDGVAGTAAAEAAPRTPTEELLAAMWSELLGIERVGIHDNFLELGGHSLLAVQLASRMRAAFGVEVPLRLLFETPTVAGLAAEVERAMRGDREPAPPPIRPLPRGAELPLSFAQQRLWIVDQIDPGSSAYNVPLAVRLRGELDAAALAACLGEIVRRHEALRTRFPPQRSGGPVQEILPVRALAAGGSSLPCIDLDRLPAARRQAEAGRIAAAEAVRPFDLARGPLVRQALVMLDRTPGRSAAAEGWLLCTLHHIISDGWSIGVLVREISALYPALRAGLPSPLPELPVQYADYAMWQRQWLSGEALERELAHWRAVLADAPLLELLPDRPHPEVPGSRAAARPVQLSPDVSSALSALARAERMTPFMVLLTAWTVLLRRYTGQLDLAVGSPVANRQRGEIEGLIGFFVNTLVLRTRLAPRDTARDALRRVRQVVLEAFAHQVVPFDLLAEALNPRRGLRRTPFFQVLFALQNAPMAALELPGLTISPLPAAADSAAKFELTLSLEETPDGVRGALQYRVDLFDAVTMERLLGHFAVLAGSLAATPDGELTALPMLSSGQTHQLLREWNDGDASLPSCLAIHDLFARRAAAAPDAVAVAYGDEQLTYGALAVAAQRLARRLRRLGVGPETPVGLCAERSPALIVALIAILQTGGHYVPLDPTHPPQRLAAIAADARLRVVLAEERSLAALLELAGVGIDGIRLLLLDALGPEPAAPGRAEPWTPVDGANLAYVVYTSGSTGQPKGVAVTHRNVARLVLDTDYVRLRAADRVAQASNTSFDAATFEIWGALLHGARLVGVTREVLLEPRRLADALRREAITTLFVTTALFHQLADLAPDSFATLGHLLFGGEAIDPAAVRRVIEQGAPRRLLHVYGPTESTTFATWQRVEAVAADASTIPIGRPIANTTFAVLDADQLPVPVGAAGELCLGGEGLARGYIHRPTTTAERFVPDGIGGHAGERWYRTGDLVRRLADGAVEFLGRLDQQVKIRGFRVEPGEIEMALTRHPAVRQAAVVVREDLRRGDRRLTAYVVAGGTPPPEAATLQAFLRRTLPEPLVPSAFVLLEALPLNANGKLDRGALPAPGAADRTLEASYVPPRTPLEAQIASAWCEVLGCERLGMHDNFFDLGGHSLLAIQAVARLRALLGRELSVVDLFQHPTVEALARALAPAAAASPGGDGQPAASRLDRGHSRGEARRAALRRRSAGTQVATAEEPAAGDDRGSDDEG